MDGTTPKNAKVPELCKGIDHLKIFSYNPTATMVSLVGSVNAERISDP